jgi:hypothetical protein
MNMNDFLNIDYLKHGNARQQKVYDILQQTQIMKLLSIYQPILVGTIPIGIDLESSDLDIICEVKNEDIFQQHLQCLFKSYPFFCQKKKANYVVATFNYKDIKIEIFGQNIPTTKQNGYQHMLIEHRLLTILGPTFKNKLKTLKKNGLKTEPAFTKILKIDGDPYKELLQLGKLSDLDLKNRFSHLQSP